MDYFLIKILINFLKQKTIFNRKKKYVSSIYFFIKNYLKNKYIL